MSATYDTSLSTDRDYVRFLIPDTDTHDAILSDEEIDGILGLETAKGKALPFMAAASCLDAIQSKFALSGRGISSKSVSKLKLTRGMDSSSAAAVAKRIKYLRARGAQLTTSSPFQIKSVNTS